MDHERMDATAELITRRLAEPETVAAAVRASDSASQYPFGFGGSSLFAGPAGSSLLFRQAARAQPERAEDWTRLAHEHLVEAVRSTHTEPLNEIGLASGTAGLALVLEDATHDDERYAGALGKVQRALAVQVLDAPDWRTEDGLWDYHYDIVTGSAGALAYLAMIADPEPAVRPAIDRVIDDLLWMCSPRAGGAPPWHLSPEHYPLPEYHQSYPHGYVNLGFAHGVPGVLAALSLAYTGGHDRPGLAAAIRYTTDYLIERASTDDHGPNWPAGIALDAAGTEVPAEKGRSRTAWCYGAPGIARALLHASAALGDETVRKFATEAFDGVLRRFAHGRVFDSVTLCHGAGGVLAMCGEFDSDQVRRTGPALADYVLTGCDPATALGVQDLEPPDTLIDNPGLLTGATGVALALWAARPGAERRALRALLIS